MITIVAIMCCTLAQTCDTPPRYPIEFELPAEVTTDQANCMQSSGPTTHACGYPLCVRWKPSEVQFVIGKATEIVSSDLPDQIVQTRDYVNTFEGDPINCCGQPAPCGPQPLTIAETFRSLSVHEVEVCVSLGASASVQLKAAASDLVEILVAEASIQVIGEVEAKIEPCYGYRSENEHSFLLGTNGTPLVVPCGMGVKATFRRSTRTAYVSQPFGYVVVFNAECGHTPFETVGEMCETGKLDGKAHASEHITVSLDWRQVRPPCFIVCE